jgi:hypothetical protein
MITPSDLKYAIQIEDNDVPEDVTIYPYIVIYIYDSNDRLVQKYSLTTQSEFKDITTENTTDIVFYLYREDLDCLKDTKLKGEMLVSIPDASFKDGNFVQSYTFQIDSLEELEKSTRSDGGY